MGKVYAYSGETVKISINVFEKGTTTPLDMTGSVAMFACKRDTGGTLFTKTAEVEGSKISVTLTAEETVKLKGDYKYEFRVHSGNEIDSLIFDDLKVTQALLGKWGAEQ